MALTGEEIRANLARFAAHWTLYKGSERSEAQTFLNELLACYGNDRREVGAQFEAPQEGRFLDMLWSGVCIIEMKAPSEAKRLSRHREQALTYWRESADAKRGIPAPRFVVLCALQKLEIWEPGRFPGEPRTSFDLVELPDRYDALMFLAGEEPVLVNGHAAVTGGAAHLVTELNGRLAERRCGGPDERRDFILQCVWSMFAEDLGQIPGHRFTLIVEDLIANPHRSSTDGLGRLFELLNDPSRERPQHGQYAGVPYANGGLFENPTRLHLLTVSLNCCVKRPHSTGARFSRRSSARCSRERSDTTSNGSLAPTTPTTRSFRRSSFRRSSRRGRSGLRTCPATARPSAHRPT